MNFMGKSKNIDPRKRILEVADRLFYADGVRATGTEKIMSLAEVAKATFYRHFESKDALVLAYLEYRDQALWDYLSQPTPAKDLREALTKFEQYVNWPEVIGCPFLRIASEFPDTAYPFHRLAIEHQNKILEYLTDLLKPFAIDQKGGGRGDTWRHQWRLLHSNAPWDVEGDYACLVRRGGAQELSERASSTPQMIGVHLWKRRSQQYKPETGGEPHSGLHDSAEIQLCMHAHIPTRRN